MTPNINQIITCYREISQIERMKCGRPGELTAKNAVRGAMTVCAAADIPLDAGVERLSRKAIDRALVKFLHQGIARISAWSYVCQLRAVFAKWTQAYYEDRGWEIPRLELPSFRARPSRYVRPTADLLRNVKAWYGQLEREAFAERQCVGGRAPGANPPDIGCRASRTASRAVLRQREKERQWLTATLMLEFAMRNGDVLRLTPSNFIEQPHPSPDDGRPLQNPTLHFLSYTPHKTELSSGRRVCWPIHPDIWRRLGPLVTDGDRPGSALLRTIDSGVFERLNRQMRLLGFNGGKGAYELRKICIDHVYQRFGAEKATALSGDDIKTITHYYADPAAATVVGVRILDLL